MNIQTDRAKEIFLDALEIDSSDARREFLDQACGGERTLLAEVEDLLAHHPRLGSFLSSMPRENEATAEYSASGADGPGTTFGPYKVLEQIGEGGFGVVYMAEQTHPVRRRIALKVLKPGMDTHSVVARFEAERQALALMDHPNIAKVLDGGETESGRPYFVMELVRGIPATNFCDRNRLDVRGRLGLFIQVCRAVQHAHQKGVIHRDLKPTNILVTLHDGVPVPKVIDFGIAKAIGQPLTEKTLFTGFAQMVGTPLYMSPEQAELSGLDVDTRSDIFSLGVLLYELLTGTTPFDQDRLRTAGIDEVRRIIREEEPARPSTRVSTLGRSAASVSANRESDPKNLSRLIRGELDWIVMKSLEKDRNRRYETAAALVADVNRYLNNEPVEACPPSAWYRFGKFTKRNRREVLAAGAAAAVSVVGVAGLGISRALILQALRSETQLKEDLTESLKREKLEAYFQRITVADRELSIDNLDAAQRALKDCPEELRGWEWHYLNRLCKIDPRFIRDSTEVNSVAFSPDGESIATAGGDGTIKIWNSRTCQMNRVLNPAHMDSVLGVFFHPHGRHLASVGADRRVRVWDLTMEPAVKMFDQPCDIVRKFGTACTAAFSPDGRLLATGSKGIVTVWDWRSGQTSYQFHGHEMTSISVAFSPDGQRIASGSTGEDLKLWDAKPGEVLLHKLRAHQYPVSAVAFSQDGSRLAEASVGRRVDLWDTATGEQVGPPLIHSVNVESVAFHPKGQRLASAGEDKTVHLWDATTGREILGLRAHKGRCGCVAFSPDSNGWRLASAGEDKRVYLWDATPLDGSEGQELFTFSQHDDEIRSVVASPDGRLVVSAGRGGIIKVWNAENGKQMHEIAPHFRVVFCLAWHPKEELIAAAGWDGRQHTVQVLDPRSRKTLSTIPPGRDKFTAAYYVIAFSPDGRFLITGEGSESGGGEVNVWDAQTGRQVGSIGTYAREVRGVVFSPNPVGRLLATASGNGEISILDGTRLDKEQVSRDPIQARVPGPCLNIAFGPDGKWLATGGDDDTIRIWDVMMRRESRPPLRGHKGDVYALAVSPDGRWIASGGEDSRVKVWDAQNDFRLAHNFKGHTGLISSVTFDPKSLRLYSGSRDHTVKAWDVSQPGEGPS